MTTREDTDMGGRGQKSGASTAASGSPTPAPVRDTSDLSADEMTAPELATRAEKRADAIADLVETVIKPTAKAGLVNDLMLALQRVAASVMSALDAMGVAKRKARQSPTAENVVAASRATAAALRAYRDGRAAYIDNGMKAKLPDHMSYTESEYKFGV